VVASSSLLSSQQDLQNNQYHTVSKNGKAVHSRGQSGMIGYTQQYETNKVRGSTSREEGGSQYRRNQTNLASSNF